MNILQDPLPHFSIQDVDFVKLQAAWEKVQEVIRIHGGAEELERMSALYDDFPVSADDERYTRPIENSTLLKLYNQFGGAMRFKSYEMYQPRIAGCEIVDGITWNGGPLTATQRDLALADAVANHPTSVALLAGVRRRKRQKKTSAQDVLLKHDSNQARLKGGAVKNPQPVGIKENHVTRQQESRSKQYVVSIWSLHASLFLWHMINIFCMQCFKSIASRQDQAGSSKEVLYAKYIGNEFTDTDDDVCFIISDVVERVEDKQLFFKYTKASSDYAFDKLNSGEQEAPPMNDNKRRRTIYEYTPCEELLNADWVEWINMTI